MRTLMGRLLFSYVLLASSAAAAGWFGADFSAEVVQISSREVLLAGRIFVSGGQVRTEYLVDGKGRVDLFLPHAQKEITLYPDRKVYRQQSVDVSLEAVGGADSPCSGFANRSCVLVGEEDLNGRRTKRWAVTTETAQSGQRQGAVWTDVQYRFPVKQIYDGLLTSELVYTGAESINGRSTEKWQAKVRSSDGQVVATVQWYDPMLNVAIRQELPGGVIRELRDIRIGPQPDLLFVVPDGYRLIQAPTEAKDDRPSEENNDNGSR